MCVFSLGDDLRVGIASSPLSSPACLLRTYGRATRRQGPGFQESLHGEQLSATRNAVCMKINISRVRALRSFKIQYNVKLL